MAPGVEVLAFAGKGPTPSQSCSSEPSEQSTKTQRLVNRRLIYHKPTLLIAKPALLNAFKTICALKLVFFTAFDGKVTVSFILPFPAVCLVIADGLNWNALARSLTLKGSLLRTSLTLGRRFIGTVTAIIHAITRQLRGNTVTIRAGKLLLGTVRHMQN